MSPELKAAKDRALAYVSRLEKENAKLREVVLECLAVMERTAHCSQSFSHKA